MKRVLTLVLVIILILGAVSFAGEELGTLGQKQEAKIKLNGEYVGEGKNKPFIVKGTTMVPIRWVIENLGKEIVWDGDNFTVFVDTKEERRKELDNIGKETLKEGGFQVLNIVVEGQVLSDFIVKPILVNATTFVPLRPISEKLGLGIEWDDVNKEVVVSTQSDNKSEEKETDMYPINSVVSNNGFELNIPELLTEGADYLANNGIQKTEGRIEKDNLIFNFNVIEIGEDRYNHINLFSFKNGNANGLDFSDDSEWLKFKNLVKENSINEYPLVNEYEEIVGTKYFYESDIENLTREINVFEESDYRGIGLVWYEPIQ